jgi:5,10-methylenetetrahydrofolate reductase
MKVTDALTPNRALPVFICDFTPPRGSSAELLNDVAKLDAEFISVAYNPGKLVRVDSVSAAAEIKRSFGRDAVFNLSPRDMNRLALQSRLLGAELLGLENLLVIQGDALTERDQTSAAADLTATGLIAAVRQLNDGLDYKGGKLRNPTSFCIGASVDLGRGVRHETELTYRKVQAGAHFFVTQPIFDTSEAQAFLGEYESVAGERMAQPVFWGLQILAADGILFSTVPESVRNELQAGRDGVDIALENYARLKEMGAKGIYLVSPIMRGGARDYDAAARFLEIVTKASD